jgi:Sulfotransferase family
MGTQGRPEFEKRIIIGGMPRSGTTLFRYILDASPTILAGPETGFFLRPFALQQAQAERVASRVNRSLELGADVIAEMIRSSTSSVEGSIG